jgi:hypothetical protein
MMWLIPRIRLVIATLLPTAHTNDDESDANDDIFAGSDGTTNEVTDNGLTQAQVNEGAPANTVAHNATTDDLAEDGSGNDESSSAKNNAITDDPVSSISEHEGDSPVTSPSSVLEVKVSRSPPLQSPSAPLRP